MRKKRWETKSSPMRNQVQQRGAAGWWVCLPKYQNLYLCESELIWVNNTDINIFHAFIKQYNTAGFSATLYCGWCTEDSFSILSDKRKLQLHLGFSKNPSSFSFASFLSFFFITKAKFWIGYNLTVSFWHSWNLWNL